MNIALNEDILHFPFAEAPAPGEIVEVAPNVGWLRMPLPTVLNHINLWVLRDDDGVTLVDTGMGTPETQEIWEEIFSGPLGGMKVKCIVCTHHHPDHMGLIGWLAERTGAPVYATPGEWAAAQRWATADRDAMADAMAAGFARAGLPESFAQELNAIRVPASAMLSLPARLETLDPATPLVAAGVSWNIIIGLGHSPELAAFHSPDLGVVISGDQVLPGISPNVSLPLSGASASDNPLGLYLETLRPFRALPADTLVLPSHKLPFHGVRKRVDDLTTHHMERLDDVRRVCGDGATAADVMQVMFRRRLTGHQVIMALGETLAHLHYLMATGEVVYEPGDPDTYRAV